MYVNYWIEGVELENPFSSALPVWTLYREGGCIVESDSGPLINGEHFVAVLEPGQVTQPFEIDRNRIVFKE